jgi:hypothetical protein
MNKFDLNLIIRSVLLNLKYEQVKKYFFRYPQQKHSHFSDIKQTMWTGVYKIAWQIIQWKIHFPKLMF